MSSLSKKRQQPHTSMTASTFYAIGQISTGLFLHPYQTLQSVVQEKIFLWLTALPAALLVILIINWRVWILPLLEFWFECQPNYPAVCTLVKILATWISFFCLYWQVLVSYLTIRFLLAFKNVKHSQKI